jgi:hypothetical protein
MGGFSWFVIDKRGKYTGHTLANKPGGNCLSYDEKGWTGRVYKLSRQMYFALNDGAEHGFIIQLAPNKQHGSSIYIGDDVGVIESNWIYKDNRFEPAKILEIVSEELCEQPD